MTSPELSPKAGPTGPRSSATAVGPSTVAEGNWSVAVFGKRTYRIESGRCVVHPSQSALVEAPRKDESGELQYDSDLVLRRREVDVVVRGHAYSHGAHERTLSVGIGEHVSVMLARGDRRATRGADGRVHFSASDAWQSLPLGWTRAYGGCDERSARAAGDPLQEVMARLGRTYDPKLGSFAYARNPIGRGYCLGLPSGSELALPNFENPRFALTPDTLVRPDAWSWPKAPIPASFGFLPYEFFPRSASWGIPPRPYDVHRIRPEDFPEVQGGWLERDAVLASEAMKRRPFDARAGQGSSPMMRIAQVHPGVAIQLEGLHPRTPKLTFALTVETPQVVLQLPGERPFELKPVMRSLVIEPDEDALSVVWVAEHEVDAVRGAAATLEAVHAVVWKT